MKKQSAEDYLDKLLNSVNDQAPEEFELEAEEVLEDEVEIKTEDENQTEMYSRRVSKSEADFLREFEAELEGEDFDDFLKEFDLGNEEYPIHDEVEEEDDAPDFQAQDIPMSDPFDIPMDVPMNDPFDVPMEDAPVENTPAQESMLDDFPLDALFGGETVAEETPSFVEDSFDLGGVDLGALLNEASGQEPAEPATAEAVPMDDMFASLFGDEVSGETPDLSDLFGNSGGDGADSLDLGNLGEADLMSLLSGEGGLSDLGDMLSQSDSAEFSMDGLDAFAAFAEGEMAAQAPAEGDTTKKAAKGKGGFLDKIKALFLSDDDDEVELKQAGPSASQLSGENDQILAQMDAEDKGAKGGLFGKKKKDKAEKPKKEKKPKAPKPKKEKKPKVEKPKKEKKPKEIDNTPPLPKGPVMLIWVMAISLLGLVYLGTNLMGYSSYVKAAKNHYNNGCYAEAYQELLGLTLKEKDMELYNQVATLATVDSELNAYRIFRANEDHTKALDSLICAAGRCELNEDSADVYGCLGQMEILRKTAENELSTYGMTYQEALDMYHIKDREDYTIALYTKLKELGLN